MRRAAEMLPLQDGKEDAARTARRRVQAARVEQLWSPLRVVVLFIVVSLAWIVGTDWLLQRLIADEDLVAVLQTGKGLLWIVIVAAMLYVLLDRARREQRLLHQEVSRQHDELEDRVRERTGKLLDSREQLRRLTRHLDQLAETERKRISRELHDQMGSDLTGLKIDLQTLLSRPTSLEGEETARIRAAVALVDSMHLNIRALASQLRPAILDEFGLIAGIEWLLEEFRRRSGCECVLDIDEFVLDADELRDTVLFRICQESLTNVLKHANATRVRVALSLDGEVLCLRVEDDGRGLDSQAESRDRLGVIGMRERAISIGGEAFVEPRPGGGTCIRVAVPLAR